MRLTAEVKHDLLLAEQQYKILLQEYNLCKQQELNEALPWPIGSILREKSSGTVIRLTGYRIDRDIVEPIPQGTIIRKDKTDGFVVRYIYKIEDWEEVVE